MAEGAIAPRDLAKGDAMASEVAGDAPLIERFELQREMIHIAPPLTRRAAWPAGWAVGGHQVDEGASGAQLVQTEIADPPLDPAAENATIPVKRAVDIGNAEHDMIEPLDRDGSHGSDPFPLWHPATLPAPPERRSFPIRHTP